MTDLCSPPSGSKPQRGIFDVRGTPITHLAQVFVPDAKALNFNHSNAVLSSPSTYMYVLQFIISPALSKSKTCILFRHASRPPSGNFPVTITTCNSCPSSSDSFDPHAQNLLAYFHLGATPAESTTIAVLSARTALECKPVIGARPLQVVLLSEMIRCLGVDVLSSAEF